jgi:SAM-dependent methyltransferase
MDPYAEIAPFYDWEHDDFTDDVSFYLNVIQGGPVLDVGIGTGRIALAVANAGFEVVGVDVSDAMMALARKRLHGAQGVQLCRGPVAELDSRSRFSVALLSLNTLWHVTELNAQIEMLRAIGRRLIPGGLLVVDVSNPLTMADREGRGELRQRFRRVVDDRTVSAYSAAWDDEGEQILTLSLTYEETLSTGASRRTCAELELRYLYRFELELALGQAGLVLSHCYGSYDLQPYGSESPNLIVIAQPA